MKYYIDGEKVSLKKLNNYTENHDIEFHSVNLNTLELYFITKG